LTIATKVLSALDSAADLLGLLDRPFDPDSLIRVSRNRTGLSDFGDTSFIGPLCRLLESCRGEAGLSVVGRSATRWDVVRFLSNLLLLQDTFARQPKIVEQPIAQPIFITGLPRSGTTFLHRLMLTDLQNRSPLVWETIYPTPASGSRDQRIARVARQLRAFERLAPTFQALHPLDATSPQECSEITAHVFRSLRFDTTYHVPSYRNWLDADVVNNLPAYRFHKRFLQYLQHHDGAPRQWVLKCPEHLFALQIIRQVYPDARIVFVHRDPVKVLLSQSELTEVLRRPFTRRLDPLALGPHESRRWLDGTQRMMAIGDDAGFPDRVCHVHHIDLISDPVSTVDGVYRHFGMNLSPEAASSIEEYVAARPKGGYGDHTYYFEDHGLDEQQERARFRPYMIHFGVTAEAVSRRPAAPMPTPVRDAGERTLLS
jgi:hypothetical protein